MAKASFTSMPHMELRYDALSCDAPEIRLITLPPGSSADIRFRLWHTTLHVPSEEPSNRLSVKELNDTLPVGWNVSETHQYKYSYLFEEDATENTTWTHPDAGCNPRLWAHVPESPPAGFQPKFESLSYTWGSSEDPEIALVEYIGANNHRQTNLMTLPIGKNLANALRHLRLPDTHRTLWVDAICINQNDVPEREQQVKNMALLYKLAWRVIVWLGPQSYDSDTAISALQYLGSQLEIGRNRFRYRAPEAVELEWFRAICPLPFTKEVWLAIINLLQRPWFERLWIWQEIQLANSRATVVCGNRKMVWQDLRKAIISLVTKHQLPALQLRERLDFIDSLTNERSSCSFNILVNISRARKCLDPRDKIYGLLSICGPTLASKIQVSYAKETVVVYKEVFLQYSHQVERLDLLSGCDSALQLAGSPSWVPNWTVPRETWPLSGFCFASGISKSELHYVSPDILQVTGVEVARIGKVAERAPLNFADILGTISKWEPQDLRTRPYVAGGSLLDAYCTTIRAGYLSERCPDIGAPSLEEWKEQYLNQISPEYPKGLDKGAEFDADVEWMFKLVRGRTFIVTEEGYIGIGPPEAKPGDRVCVLLGCKTPMVLRTAAGGNAFHVIGECYVHGMDDCVALLGPLPSNVRIQMGKTASGYSAVHTYLDLHTGIVCSEDPRLRSADASNVWERITHDWNADDPDLFEYYKNMRTGEDSNSDPRLLSSNLNKMGVPLKTFNLQ